LEFLIWFHALDSYQQADLVKLDILLNGQPVDAMATIVHNLKAQRIGRELVDKLKKFIERLVVCDC
jgi:translation factor GUF1, mitochondrial